MRYTGAFPGFPSVSADLHQPPLWALSIPGAWVLRSPDLVVVSSFRMHCSTVPSPSGRTDGVLRSISIHVFYALGIQPCHPSGSKPAAHFFRTEVRTRDLQVAMTSRYQLYQYQFFVIKLRCPPNFDQNFANRNGFPESHPNFEKNFSKVETCV